MVMAIMMPVARAIMVLATMAVSTMVSVVTGMPIIGVDAMGLEGGTRLRSGAVSDVATIEALRKDYSADNLADELMRGDR